jgi:hypothetical protein
MTEILDPLSHARRMARDGYGWENIVKVCGVTEKQAKELVFEADLPRIDAELETKEQ